MSLGPSIPSRDPRDYTTIIAGPDACAAAGGSVQAVIDEETPRLDNEEGEILAVAEGQVFSSTDEEGSDLESETD